MRADLRGTVLFATICCVMQLNGCAVNPATGERQLAFMSESQEVALGQNAAKDVSRSIGLYEDESLQAYVNRVGQQMAAASERPELPWQFSVADDDVVNAFALPGGFIYLTRGIMAYFNSEAEMAAVLGHEIGHVTGRHSVEQMSRAQLAQIGLGLGMIFAEPLRQFGDIAGQGLQLMFLKYGRDDEREADQLGLRYMGATNFERAAAVNVFEMLAAQRNAAGGSTVPDWMSTHPSPEDRIARINATLSQLPDRGTKGRVAQEDYLRQIDGMAYGKDPQAGYFRGDEFIHPGLYFRVSIPENWQRQNLPNVLVAISPQKNASIQLTLTDAKDPQAAAQKFFSQNGVQGGPLTRGGVNELPAVAAQFQAQSQQGTISGLATFIGHGGRVYQILGMSAPDQFAAYQNTFLQSVRSFARLTDPKLINVSTKRLSLLRTARQTSVNELLQKNPSPLTAEELALLNSLGPNQPIARNQLIKWVVGGD